ncbi:MAG: hypothetical protein ABL974_09025, partial [Prosthecobacter sp.]
MSPTDFSNTITTPGAGDVIACITHQSSFHVSAWSYAEAAQMLARHLNEDGFYIDIGVHPICFLYRHSLELQFKQIVWDGRQLIGEDARIEQLCRSHALTPLWSEIEAIMNQVWPDLPFPDEALLVREVVTWFHEVDPGSFAFRYPFDKNLQASLSEFRHINLSTLVAAMEASRQF